MLRTEPTSAFSAARRRTPVVAPAPSMTGVEMVLTALKEQGVGDLFGYPGGVILSLYRALEEEPSITHTRVQHEQAAVHAAQGYARATGKVGCVLVTSGPGATNSITGLADAQRDGTPIVLIAGQVPSPLIGTEAFQECAFTSIARPCVKKSVAVRRLADLSAALHDAFRTAQTGRPGPVVVEIPPDILSARGPYLTRRDWEKRKRKTTSLRTPKPDYDEAARLIALAERPVFLAGGGLARSGESVCENFAALARRMNIPVAMTLMGLGAVPYRDPLSLGMAGIHGTLEAKKAMDEADLIVGFGARFDNRVTGPAGSFAPRAKIIHIDLHPQAIGKTVPTHLGILDSCANALKELCERLPAPAPDRAAWLAQIEAWRRADCLRVEPEDGVLKPQAVIRAAAQALTTARRDFFVTTDVGQHQMWTAQYFPFDKPGRLITSGGFGTMGFGLPAGLGAQIAQPEALVLCVTGDGSLLMKIQEMATARQRNLPVKVLLLNNEWLGMVRQLQAYHHGGVFAETSTAGQPDFVAVAKGFGWKAARCAAPNTLEAAVKDLLAAEGPALLECRVDPGAMVYSPFLPAPAKRGLIHAATP